MSDSYYETGRPKPTDTETALAMVYAYASNSYAMYTALVEHSLTFSEGDKLRFRGVVDESAAIVYLIRVAHPGTAEKVDSFRAAHGRLVVPPSPITLTGMTDEIHLRSDH